MKCKKHGPMKLVKTETNIDLGFRGLRHIEEHYVCTQCNIKGAQFTTMMAPKRKNIMR